MEEKTLIQARDEWRETIHNDGGVCPCCARWGKVYNRQINGTMAFSLAWLYGQNKKKGIREWIDVPNTAPKFVLRSNQLSTLRWWGLVERQLPEPDDTNKHSGMWRMTLRGMDFVDNLVLVPKKVFTYNGEVVKVSDELVSFESCKDKRFDYNEVMSGSTPDLVGSLVKLTV